MLDCALTQSSECKEDLSEWLRKDIETSSLASIVLEEWALSLDDPSLAQPRLVWSPELTREDVQAMVPERVEWSFIVIRGKVDRVGRPYGGKVLKASKYPRLDKAVLDAFTSSCYRPARKGSKFVDAEAVLSFRLEVR
jgi:hypothetical protein